MLPVPQTAAATWRVFLFLISLVLGLVLFACSCAIALARSFRTSSTYPAIKQNNKKDKSKERKEKEKCRFFVPEVYVQALWS